DAGVAGQRWSGDAPAGQSKTILSASSSTTEITDMCRDHGVHGFRSATSRVLCFSRALRATVLQLGAHRGGVVVVAFLALASSAYAQQRPLVTQDPETIGAGRILIEGGIDVAHDYQNPVSGLKGNLLSVPTIGISVGISSIAELQIDGGLYNRLNITTRNPNAPLA